MTEVTFSYSFRISFDQPVVRHCFLVRCLPRQEWFQSPREISCTVQGRPFRARPDSFGNPVIVGSENGTHQAFAVTAQGRADMQTYRICDVLHPMYRAATPLTSCTEEMLALARSCAAAHPTIETAMGVVGQVHGRLAYTKGVTTSFTTAAEAFALRQGVCQDYAHLSIALLRAAGIPARYVCGFISGEGESHAWIEVFLDGVWRGLDPTHERVIDFGYIKVAHGRDSADCPMNRGTFTGGGRQSSSITITVS